MAWESARVQLMTDDEDWGKRGTVLHELGELDIGDGLFTMLAVLLDSPMMPCEVVVCGSHQVERVRGEG